MAESAHTMREASVIANDRTIPRTVPTVRCAYYDVTELADPQLWERGIASLPWHERYDAIARFKFDKDKRLCLGAGLVATDMLRQAGATDLTLAYGARGKPYLSAHPDIHFNLSHSGSLAVCAVSTVAVGVDVETYHDHGHAVAKHCFTAQELAWLDEQENTASAFARLWTRKEALIKLTGSGLSRDLLSFCTLNDDESCQGIRFVEHQLPGHALCVCTEGPSVVVFSSWSFAHRRRRRAGGGSSHGPHPSTRTAQPEQ